MQFAGTKSGNPQAVLDGDLDRFLEAALAQGAGDRRPDTELSCHVYGLDGSITP